MNKRECRVTLECGCIALREGPPFNGHVRYPCPSNMGHGYSKRWTSWSSPKVGERTNKSAPSRRSESIKNPAPEGESVAFGDVELGDRLSFGTYSPAVRRTVWREGVVMSLFEKSVRVWTADGTLAQLNKDRWSQREVRRLF